jgi:excisionase family DNA binding protein
MSATLTDSLSQYLTPPQTSELIGVGLQTLAVWRTTGRYRLPFVKVGRLVRYRRADVEAWLNSRTVVQGAEG